MSTPFTTRGHGPVQPGDSHGSSAYLGTPTSPNPPFGAAATTDHTHSIPHYHSASLFNVGILRDTLIPSLTLHSGLALAAWGAAAYTGRVEAKDWLWPSGQVINAWWSAVGRKVYSGLTLTQAMARLSWPERLLLSGVTLWGGRLFYRIASRSIKRGKDDPRYEAEKKEEGYWVKSLFTNFVPEAVFQMLISLPFTAPFRHEGAVLTGYHPYVQMAAVGMFSAGFAMETLADWQLDRFKEEGGKGILREGVWSIVRHPNYLGDALVHASFIVLLYGSDMLAPIELLGPLANYAFLRYFGGDKQTEAHQERRYSESKPEKMVEFERFREDKNAFWPRVKEFGNQWLWTVVGVGAVGVAVEEALRTMH